jgi:predicted hydrolase (HD superfamily)
MLASASGGKLDIANFSVGDMLRAGLALRQVVRDAGAPEEVAGLVVGYLYDTCVDRATGQRACALVRFYKTHRLGDLQLGVRQFAESQLGSTAPRSRVRTSSAERFAVILSARTQIPAGSAARFRTIALDVRSALYAFPEDRTWTTE